MFDIGAAGFEFVGLQGFRVQGMCGDWGGGLRLNFSI